MIIVYGSKLKHNDFYCYTTPVMTWDLFLMPCSVTRKLTYICKYNNVQIDNSDNYILNFFEKLNLTTSVINDTMLFGITLEQDQVTSSNNTQLVPREKLKLVNDLVDALGLEPGFYTLDHEKPRMAYGFSFNSLRDANIFTNLNCIEIVNNEKYRKTTQFFQVFNDLESKCHVLLTPRVREIKCLNTIGIQFYLTRTQQKCIKKIPGNPRFYLLDSKLIDLCNVVWS
jgi:hypothetical protein